MKEDTINLLTFLEYYGQEILVRLGEHLRIVLLSVPLSIAISVPIGFSISGRPRLAKAVIYGAGVLMTVPSLALFGLMVVALAPVNLGLGVVPAVVAILVYSLLPIIRNTYTALEQVDPRMIEAARGTGLTERQILYRIKLPLSIPVIMAGVRNAVVLGISVAVFASLVGAGGLGYFIFSGIGRTNFYMVLSGAITVSVLGVGANWLLMRVERWVTPKGLRVAQRRAA